MGGGNDLPRMNRLSAIQCPICRRQEEVIQPTCPWEIKEAEKLNFTFIILSVFSQYTMQPVTQPSLVHSVRYILSPSPHNFSQYLLHLGLNPQLCTIWPGPNPTPCTINAALSDALSCHLQSIHSHNLWIILPTTYLCSGCTIHPTFPSTPSYGTWLICPQPILTHKMNTNHQLVPMNNAQFTQALHPTPFMMHKSLWPGILWFSPSFLSPLLTVNDWLWSLPNFLLIMHDPS